MRHHGGGGVGCCFELCGAPADVHCAADSAFLCASCDAKVHGANTLASRHRRTRLLLEPAGSPSPGARAEVVLEGWAKRTGLASGSEARRRAAAAARALRDCVRDLASMRVPPRVAMAAALWREVAGHGGIGRGEALRHLEACAHVPARLVVAVDTSLARARARRRGGPPRAPWRDKCASDGPKSSLAVINKGPARRTGPSLPQHVLDLPHLLLGSLNIQRDEHDW